MEDAFNHRKFEGALVKKNDATPRAGDLVGSFHEESTANHTTPLQHRHESNDALGHAQSPVVDAPKKRKLASASAHAGPLSKPTQAEENASKQFHTWGREEGSDFYEAVYNSPQPPFVCISSGI